MPAAHPAPHGDDSDAITHAADADPDHPENPLPPIRIIRGLLGQVARRARDGATIIEDWEAQSLLSTTVEVLKCLDEAYERYERRHPPRSASAGPGQGAWNHPPTLNEDARA